MSNEQRYALAIQKQRELQRQLKTLRISIDAQEMTILNLQGQVRHFESKSIRLSRDISLLQKVVGVIMTMWGPHRQEWVKMGEQDKGLQHRFSAREWEALSTASGKTEVYEDMHGEGDIVISTRYYASRQKQFRFVPEPMSAYPDMNIDPNGIAGRIVEVDP